MPQCPYCQSQQVRRAAHIYNAWYSLIGRHAYHCRNCQHNFNHTNHSSQRSSRDTRAIKEVVVMLLLATVLVSFTLIISYIEITPNGLHSL